MGEGGLISVGGTVISNKIALIKRYDENTDEYKFKIFKSERKDRENRKIKAINEINNARENFLSFKDVFDSEGNIDRIKLISKLQKFEDLQNRFDATEDVENPVIKKDLQERLFSELVLIIELSFNGEQPSFLQCLHRSRSAGIYKLHLITRWH